MAIEFAARLPVGSMGRRVSKFESLLPRNAAVRLVKESPDVGVGEVEVEVYLDSLSPAMALRDVSRAVELVAATPENKVSPGSGPTAREPGPGSLFAEDAFHRLRDLLHAGSVVPGLSSLATCDR